MAIDHVGEGVRVNALCPGTTQTPWIERLVAEQGEKLEDLEARQPLGRLGTAEEMADGALYLGERRVVVRHGHRSSWSTAG